MRKFVRPYDPDWPDIFAAEASLLRRALEPKLTGLSHIGSTSVPGMVAKPIVDMLGEVRRLDDIENYAAILSRHGYDARGPHGIEGRRYFSKAAKAHGDVGFHLHVFAIGSPQIDQHIRFRNYLIASPAAASEYAALKLSLCDPAGVLAADYADRKAPFIERIIGLATS